MRPYSSAAFAAGAAAVAAGDHFWSPISTFDGVASATYYIADIV